MKINSMKTKHSQENLMQICAIEIALGCSLPSDIHQWPIGLVRSWNEANEDGAFKDCVKVGDMSTAWLKYRAKKLP